MTHFTLPPGTSPLPGSTRPSRVDVARVGCFPDRRDERTFHRFGHRIEWHRNREHEAMVLRVKMMMEDLAA